MSTKLTYEELEKVIKPRPLTQEDRDNIIEGDISLMRSRLSDVKILFERHKLIHGVDNHDYISRIDSLIDLIEEDYKEDIDNLVIWLKVNLQNEKDILWLTNFIIS